MNLVEFLEVLENEVTSAIEGQTVILKTFKCLIAEARQVALSAPEKISELEGRKLVSRDQIYGVPLDTIELEERATSKTSKHFRAWEKVLDSIQTSQFIESCGFQARVERVKVGRTLKGYGLLVFPASAVDELGIDEVNVNVDRANEVHDEVTISDDLEIKSQATGTQVRYRLLEYYRDIGPRNWLQEILPRHIDIGSGRRGLMLLTLAATWVVPALLLNISNPSPSILQIFITLLSSLLIFGLFWLHFGAFFIVVESGYFLAPIPYWLHFIYHKWNVCQLYAEELDTEDWFGKPIYRIRVGRMESDCLLCDEARKAKIDVHISLWRPWNVFGRCTKSKNEHKYSCRPSEMTGELIQK